MNMILFEDDLTVDGSPAASSATGIPQMGFAAGVAGIEILNEGRYRAFVQDLECVWRWEIHRDGEFVQEGCSLSESSSREAVGHVISFYQRRDNPSTASSPPSDDR